MDSQPPTSQALLGLHQHSVFSTLDGCSHPREYVNLALETGSPVCAVTDHGMVSGWHDLRCSCETAGIRPVYGLEIYLLPRDGYRLNPDVKRALNYFHLTLWALNQEGYRSLSALASGSWAQTHRNRPLTTWDSLSLYSAGVACGSGCVFGPVAYPMIRGERAEAALALCQLREIFKDRLFLEIMPHAVDRDYSGRDRQVVSVIGGDGSRYNFDPADTLETNLGRMSAAEAAKAGVTEIYTASPVRGQDGPGLTNDPVTPVENIEPLI